MPEEISTNNEDKTISDALKERYRLQEQTAKVRKRVKEMIASSRKVYKSSGFANDYPARTETDKPAKNATVIVTGPDDKRRVCRVIKTSPLTVLNTATGEQFKVTKAMKVLN